MIIMLPEYGVLVAKRCKIPVFLAKYTKLSRIWLNNFKDELWNVQQGEKLEVTWLRIF